MPVSDNTSKVIEVDINEILPNRFQPRRQFDEDEILELSDSIREHGIIQPIVVRTIGDKYEIIAGERRYKASVLAGLENVPVIVKNLNDKESAEIALIENIQRKNLTPIEEALSYKQILDMGYLTQENLATKLGKSQSAVANKIRLLNLSDEVQEALLESKISERHARSLLRLQGEEAQNKMLDRIINERLTVRKTDEEIDKIKNGLENPIEIKEEKEEESMNNNINMMPNMTSPQDTQSSFNFFGSSPVQSPKQPNSQEFNMFSNSATPSVNISNIDSVEESKPVEENSSQINMPTFDFENMNPIFEQLQKGNNEMNNFIQQPNNLEIQNNISTPNIETSTLDMTNNEQSILSQSPNFDMFANAPAPSINIPNIEQTPVAQPQESTPSIPSFDFNNIQPIVEPINGVSQSIDTISQPQSVENSFQIPTFDTLNSSQPVSQNNDIKFDANGMIVNQNTSQVPITSPIIEQPSVESTPVIQPSTLEMGNTSRPTLEPVQSQQTVEPQFNSQPEQMKIPEPIIVTDYSKQYDPIMPNQQNSDQLKAPLKDVINAIRECSAKIEQYGYKIDVEEYDLANIYQVVFKVEK